MVGEQVPSVGPETELQVLVLVEEVLGLQQLEVLETRLQEPAQERSKPNSLEVGEVQNSYSVLIPRSL